MEFRVVDLEFLEDRKLGLTGDPDAAPVFEEDTHAASGVSWCTNGFECCSDCVSMCFSPVLSVGELLDDVLQLGGLYKRYVCLEVLLVVEDDLGHRRTAQDDEFWDDDECRAWCLVVDDGR